MTKNKSSMLSLILIIAGILVFLILGIVDYILFLKTWEFAWIDILFQAAALLTIFFYLQIPYNLTVKDSKSLFLIISVIALIVAWILAKWVIFRNDPRLSELLDFISSDLFIGLAFALFGKSLRSRKTE